MTPTPKGDALMKRKTRLSLLGLTCLLVTLLTLPASGLGQDKDKDKKEDEDRRPDVIFVPTPQEVVDKMLELCKVKYGDVHMDLGCGDGRLCVTAAKKYGVRSFGYD